MLRRASHTLAVVSLLFGCNPSDLSGDGKKRTPPPRSASPTPHAEQTSGGSPGQDAAGRGGDDDDRADTPQMVTGTYLTCSNPEDGPDGAVVGCTLFEQASGKRVDLGSAVESSDWKVSRKDGAAIPHKVKPLAVAGGPHVQLVFTGLTASSLIAQATQIVIDLITAPLSGKPVLQGALTWVLNTVLGVTPPSPNAGTTPAGPAPAPAVKPTVPSNPLPPAPGPAGPITPGGGPAPTGPTPAPGGGPTPPGTGPAPTGPLPLPPPAGTPTPGPAVTPTSTSTSVSGPDVHVKLGASTADGATALTLDFPASELGAVSEPTVRRRAAVEAAPKTQAIAGGGILIKMPPQEVEIQFRHDGKRCTVTVAVDTRVPDDDFRSTCEKE